MFAAVASAPVVPGVVMLAGVAEFQGKGLIVGGVRFGDAVLSALMNEWFLDRTGVLQTANGTAENAGGVSW